MWDIIGAIHKALKIESTWAFVSGVAFICAILGGAAAWVIDVGYRNSAEYKEEHAPKQKAVVTDSSTTTVVTATPNSSSQGDSIPPRPEPKPVLPDKTNKPTKPQTKDKPSVSTSGNNSPAVGSVNQGPGSIAQVGGTGNQATVINQAPDYPNIGDAAFNRLVTQLRANIGAVAFETRNGNNQALNYSSLLVRLFSAAQWTIKGNENKTAPPDVDDEGAIPIPSGLHLFPNDGKSELATFVKETLASVGVACTVDTGKRRVMNPQPGTDIAFFVGNPK